MTSSQPSVEITTVIDAPREVVFDAWLTPSRLVSFLCAGDTQVTTLEVDARVGGAFRVVMSNDRGAYDHRGRYLEIDRPTRLCFTWISDATRGEETEVTVTFESVDGGTRMVLVHLGLRDGDTTARHERGWQSIVTKCRQLLADVGV